METVLQQVNHFSARCNELKDSRFILFPTKLSELFRVIASSPDVLSLFKECAKDFSYPEAQEKYMRPTLDGKAELFLPEDNREKIAFLFCLLSDFDNGNVDFDLFLQVFYNTDDGPDKAFSAFCEAIFPPLVAAVTEELLEDSPIPTEKTKRPRAVVLAEILAILGEERKNVLYSVSLPDGDKAAGNAILSECVAALKTGLASTAQALILGYWYFSLNADMDKRNAQKLLRLSEEL